jgi:hypothetical protein
MLVTLFNNNDDERIFMSESLFLCSLSLFRKREGKDESDAVSAQNCASLSLSGGAARTRLLFVLLRAREVKSRRGIIGKKE